MLRRLSWLVVILAAAVIVAALAGIRSYSVFTREELVAIVACEPAPAGSEHRFLLTLRQLRLGAPAREEEFPMHGEQWMLGGDILKWPPWLVFLGAQPCHKLTRLSSRYRAAEDEMKKPRSAYDLNGGTPLVWRWLYRFGEDLPLVDAVYGNAAYTDAVPGGRWGLYVTDSGYLVRPLRNG